VPNPDGHLLPGSYAEVHFAVPIQITRISIPVNALLFRPEGPRVAVVGADHKVHMKAISIGRDFGTKVEILGGLGPDDQIVVKSRRLAGRWPGSKHQDRRRGRNLEEEFFPVRLGPPFCSSCWLDALSGPNYRRPDVAVAPAWKEQPPWRAAEPEIPSPRAIGGLPFLTPNSPI